MKRRAKIIRLNDSQSRVICVDVICVDVDNYKEILEYIGRNEKHKKKFNFIVEIILNNLKNRDVYDKENIDKKSKGVTAMKFFKGGSNDRIYCQEKTIGKNTFIVIASVLFEKKKTQGVKQKVKNIIHKVANYEYEIIK